MREAKASLRGAGPSAGPMLRSGSLGLVRQELAARAAATEMTRGLAPKSETTHRNQTQESHVKTQMPKARGIECEPLDPSVTQSHTDFDESLAPGPSLTGLALRY
jgi:hypothetical protein